jgi:hypothetical protein
VQAILIMREIGRGTIDHNCPDIERGMQVGAVAAYVQLMKQLLPWAPFTYEIGRFGNNKHQASNNIYALLHIYILIQVLVFVK